MNILDILNSPWAIMPEKYVEIREIYLRHLRGETADLGAIEAKLGKPLETQRQPYIVQDGIAEIELVGVIAKRMNLFTQISGGVSTQLAGQDVRAALADPAVEAVLLTIDSPGGVVDGTEELARVVRAGREQKPMVALADGRMTSAAYWIGSAASAIYAVDNTTMVGSIGVIATHVDQSKANEMRGLKLTPITAGKYKAAGSPHQPLDEESARILQGQVDAIYRTFVESVAENRGVTPQRVLDDMADGRIFIGREAVTAGLVDGIRTREQVIDDLKRQAAARTARAQFTQILSYSEGGRQ